MNEEEMREILRRAREEYRSELAVAVLRLADALEQQRPWMNAKEAARFLGYGHGQFGHLASQGHIPRHKPRGAGYRYYAPELTEWMLSL